MKHKELIHNEDRFFYYRFYRLYSSTENKRTVTEHCSIQRLVTRFIFSKIATNFFGKYLHHKKQKRARVIPTKKKNNIFPRVARHTIFHTSLFIAIFGFGRSLQIRHYTGCMCTQRKVDNITNVIRRKKIDMSSPRSLEAIRRWVGGIAVIKIKHTSVYELFSSFTPENPTKC